MEKFIPIIIPAYEPDIRLINLLKDIRKSHNGPVILVNDGSGIKYDRIFSMAQEILQDVGGKLLVHEKNRGKGRALKTAFDYVMNEYPEAIGVVTADSDGQHTVTCIERVKSALLQYPYNIILGVRKFDGEGIPWKSRFGNALTEKIFAYVAGIHVSDTQTGLRGIPVAFLPELLEVPGERFEYEMQMLMECAGKYYITEIPIETIYDSEDNHQTHFDPIADSIRIYKILGKKFVKYIFASFSSCVIDIVLFAIFCSWLKTALPGVYLAVATAGARVLSAIYNYAINYRIVFRSNESIGRSGIKYFVLAVIQMCCSAGGVILLKRLIPIFPDVLTKIIVDTILFFISYHIQQRYVFRQKLNN